MGTFRVSVQVGNLSGRRWQTYLALLDTSASHSRFPGHTLLELGIVPKEWQALEIARGQGVSYEIGEARLRLKGREWMVPVLFEEATATPVIGRTTLAIFGLGVNSRGHRLVSARIFQ